MDENCSICLNNLNESNKNGIYTIDKCEHKFHTDCFIRWCKQGSFTCPLCRNDSFCNIDYMCKKTRLSFLRKSSLRKDSPIILREIADKVRENEKSMKDHKRELKQILRDNKELFDKLNKSKLKYRHQVIKYRKSEERLLSYPLLES